MLKAVPACSRRVPSVESGCVAILIFVSAGG